MRDRVSALLRALASIFWLCVAAMILSNTAAIAKDELITKSLPQSTFSAVSIRIPADIELRPSTQDHVNVSAEAKVIAALKITVRGDTLIVDAGSFETTKPVKIVIEAKNLRSLAVDSSATIVLTALTSERFSVKSNSSATVTLKQLATDQLKIVTSGSETIKVAGRTRTFDVDVGGSGEIDASALDAQTVNAKASGASTARVRSSVDLLATASDSATITYQGKGRVKKQVSDVGEVTRSN